MCPRLVVLAALLAGCEGALSLPEPVTLDPYIWRVLTRRDGDDQPVSGTGFLIQGAQVLITSYHVIDGARTIAVLAPGRALLPARVLKASNAHDIAILTVEGLSSSGLLLSPREEAAKDQPVWAAGYPGAAGRGRIDLDTAKTTLTQGLVNRTLYQSWEKGGPVLAIVQHDAKLGHGNSGGPLLDACGHIVGVNTPAELAEQALETYSYALGVAELRGLLNGWGIVYRNAEKPCAAAPGQRPVWWSVGLAVVLVATALALALGRPRERLAQVAENYSRRYRRRSPISKARQAPARRSPATALATLALRRADDVLCVLSCPAGQSRHWTIGRSAALCDHVIDDDTVSRRHVRLLWQSQSGRWYVEDLNSSNGTWLDGRALPAYEPIALYQGARLTLGELQLTVAGEAQSVYGR